jgi:Flp pilus assembly pilin Flp
VRSLLSDRGGVTAIEYALMAAFITLVIIGAVQTLGQQALTQLFTKVATSL